MSIPVLPEWLGTALYGAAIAAIGYVAKELIDWIRQLRREERARRARLVELLALLRAGDAAWAVQSENRDRLRQLMLARDGTIPEQGFDRLFSRGYATMTKDERELHQIIRAITMHTFEPLNEKLLEWLSTDVTFRVRSRGDSKRARLAQYLADLEAHLLLWKAKYQAWIPDHKERSLVYLADEERHGVGFPQGGATLIRNILDESSWIGA